jgi:single-strand DNA-binding protein
MIFANQVTLCGKVVKDPIFSKTKSDKSVCKIIIVVERSIGGSAKRSDYIPIALWAKKADVANDIVRRGDELMIVGTVAQERWETADHDKRSRIVVQADKFWVIPPPSDDDYIDEEDEIGDSEDEILEKMENAVEKADSVY